MVSKLNKTCDEPADQTLKNNDHGRLIRIDQSTGINLAKQAATHLAKYTGANIVTQHVNLRRPTFKAVITAVDRPAPRLLNRDVLHNVGAVFQREKWRGGRHYAACA